MIIICEPQCCGFEHSSVNAALIGAVACACPDEELTFLAEREHITHVKKILDEHSVAVSYSEMPIPFNENSTPIRRFPKELSLCQHVFQWARENGANKILFCSVTNSGLVSVKIWLKIYRDIFCFVILHSMLLGAVTALPLTPQRLLFSVRLWMSFGNLERLRYIVLGQLIEDRLKHYLPNVSNYVDSVDLPYFFNASPRSEPFEGGSIHFGFCGVGSFRKGTADFFGLAEEIRSTTTVGTPKFTLIGPLEDKALSAMPHASVSIPSPDLPLDYDAYQAYIERIDYALLFHKTKEYELVASGAVLDAFASAKPIIALKSPLVEYYFKRMGDIGYLCESPNDMKSTILDILETKPIDRYRTQQNNILIKREQFSPLGISSKLRALLQLIHFKGEES